MKLELIIDIDFNELKSRIKRFFNDIIDDPTAIDPTIMVEPEQVTYVTASGKASYKFTPHTDGKTFLLFDGRRNSFRSGTQLFEFNLKNSSLRMSDEYITYHNVETPIKIYSSEPLKPYPFALPSNKVINMDYNGNRYRLSYVVHVTTYYVLPERSTTPNDEEELVPVAGEDFEEEEE